MSPTTAFTSAFEEFQKSIAKEVQLNTAMQSHYNLRSQSKEGEENKYQPSLQHYLYRIAYQSMQSLKPNPMGKTHSMV